LQVTSGTTGSPVHLGGIAVSAVFNSGCDVDGVTTLETVYFDNVTAGPGGWFNFPHESANDDDIAGTFNLTVTYQGQTYLFQASSHPVSTTCVTLAVPSGVVTLASYFVSNSDCAGNPG